MPKLTPEQLLKLVELKVSKDLAKSMSGNRVEVKGEKGDDGKTPQKGVDYWTESDVKELVRRVMSNITLPIKGKDYFTEEEVEDIVKKVKALIPEPEKVVVNYNKIISEVTNLIPIPEDGQDGSPDTPEEVRDKLESLKGENRLDAFAIKNLEDYLKESETIKFVGGGGSSLTVRKDGAIVGSGTAINFTGSGVSSVTHNGNTATVTISGGSSVAWADITGTQSDVNVSGFTNDSGFISDLSSFDTDDLSEGATNLYYTDARVGTYLSANNYLASGDNVSELVNDAGYLTSYTETQTLQDVTDLGAVTTNTIIIGDGNASTPALAFGSDTDSGFFYQGSGRWTWSGNGTSRFIMDTGGIYSTGSGFDIQRNSSAAAPTYAFTGNTGTGTHSGGNTDISWSVNGSTKFGIAVASSVVASIYYDISNYAAFTVGSAGRLTIGPSGNQVLFPAGTAGAPSITFTTESDTGFYQTGTDQIGFTTGGTARFFMNTTALRSSGVGGISINYTATQSATNPGYSIRGDEDTGMYSDTANTLKWATGGTLRMTLTSSGSVGIGVASPLGKLEVRTGSSGQTTANTNADELVLNASGNGGLSIFTPSANFGVIAFGDESAAAVGQIRYDHTGNYMAFYANGAEHSRIDSNGILNTKSIYPSADDTYYLGKNDDDTPFAWKGVILRDQSTGTYYRVEISGGSLQVVDLTD